ncbi:MAG TPA: anion permease, partial [Citreicella sp.]|nr:anion permease [Citreicella sp.]
MQRGGSHHWKTLDRDLGRLSRLEAASLYAARPLVGVGLALVFVIVAALMAGLTSGTEPGGLVIILAAAVGAYMALNIGANDVAN